MVKKHFISGLNFFQGFIVISFFLALSSCSKEESFIEPSTTPDELNSDLQAEARLNNILSPELFGIYTHPDYLAIGTVSSENAFLDYLKRKGGNMINSYARNSMATSSGRTKFAAFCRKAINTYGVKLITCDIRETSELATWDAFYTAYPDLRTVVAPLTEKEPWVTRDYSGCFTLLRLTKAMCNRYGAKFYFYEGWMGKNYSNPQSAVDSMVYYCDGIFISNYVSVTDYLSTAAGYGKWDNRIKYRIDQGSSSYGGITKAAKKFNKLDYPLIELQSVETSYLFSVYATSGNNRSFYGTMYSDAKALYNMSSPDVIKYTELKGKSLFYQKYVLLAQPI
ncbi:MAG: hypothetical protein EYC69_06050 [Bacteroidetes bacterium]|nr:MAG: hypothetical protein EYC69_06050 [Bacteroidota bacterium]